MLIKRFIIPGICLVVLANILLYMSISPGLGHKDTIRAFLGLWGIVSFIGGIVFVVSSFFPEEIFKG
jgi:hypothetical protein